MQKELSLIANMDQNRLIGTAQGIPWKISSDLQRFKKITWGYPIVMGRKTHQSIGRVLPGRMNHVVTRNRAAMYPNMSDIPEGVTVWSELKHAIHYAEGAELFVIGGGQIYEQTLSCATDFHLSVIPMELPPTAEPIYFPAFVGMGWAVEAYDFVPADPANKDQYPHHYFHLRRADHDLWSHPVIRDVFPMVKR